MGGSEKSRFWVGKSTSLLGTGVLRDGLGTLTDGVLCKLSRQQQTDGSLHFTTGDRRSPVVVGETRSFGSNTFKDVVDKAVHYGHSLAADAGVWVNLLQYFVDVDCVALPSTSVTLLVTSAYGLGLAGRLLCSLTCWLWWHD